MTDSHLPPSLRKDKYVNRRKMAWFSFYYLMIFGTLLLIFGLTTDERAQRIDALSFLIGMITGVPTSILLAYFGATTITDRAEIKASAEPEVQVDVKEAIVIPPEDK